MTPQQALAGLTAADPEVQADTLRAISSLPVMPELYAVTVSNLDSPNESVVFLLKQARIAQNESEVEHLQGCHSFLS